MFSGLIDGLIDIYERIQEGFTASYTMLLQVHDNLELMKTQLTDITTEITSGTITSQVSILEIMSTYKYIVGDVIYYYTYIGLIIGCGLVIVKLIFAIIEEIKNLLSSSTSTSKLNIFKS